MFSGERIKFIIVAVLTIFWGNVISETGSLAMERVKILTVLDELKTPVTLNELTGKAALSRGKTLGLLQKLVREDYVGREGKCYLIAPKGQIALRELNPIHSGEEFYFYLDLGQYTGVLAKSLDEFLERLRTIDVRSLEFHMSRGDFEAWIRDIFEDQDLVREFVKLKETGAKGEDLRMKLSEVVDKRYREFCKLLV